VFDASDRNDEPLSAFRVIAQICRKYVVKQRLSAKSQNDRVAVFAQIYAVSLSEFVRNFFKRYFGVFGRRLP